jgi:paraquat-inducible protein B
MSKKINPTSLGLFIVTGLALGVAGLLLFSSARLFSSSTRCVLYFDTSLNGLNEGAPVKYRGVTIGSVERVMIHYNQATNDTAMPVLIEIRDDLVRDRWVGQRPFESFSDLDKLVRAGLRASLETESLVTGVLYVNLDILKTSPPPHYHQVKGMYLEIPTRPTDIQQLLRNLARLDIAGLTERLNALITRIDNSLSGLKVTEISEGLTNLVSSLQEVVSSPSLTNSLTGLENTLEQYRLLALKVHDRVDPLADTLTGTLDEAGIALAQIQSGVQSLRDLLAPDSALRHELTMALDQLANAAHSISALGDYLQTHPNALITGRRATQNQP